ncbi:tetratricopeptide repeat protein [Desulfobacterales bacterium HSG16]|nr:tetratricopeptide repeat protein [Desulfobacterales bacterium HSG16]
MDCESSQKIIGTSLEDLLVQKNVKIIDPGRYESRIKELEQKVDCYESRIKELEQKNKISAEKNKSLSKEADGIKASLSKLETQKSSLFQKAVSELKNKNSIDAMGLLQAVLAYDPENIKAMINLAVVYADLDFDDKAIEILNRVLAKDPNNATAKTNLEILAADKDE